MCNIQSLGETAALDWDCLRWVRANQYTSRKTTPNQLYTVALLHFQHTRSSSDRRASSQSTSQQPVGWPWSSISAGWSSTGSQPGPAPLCSPQRLAGRSVFRIHWQSTALLQGNSQRFHRLGMDPVMSRMTVSRERTVGRSSSENS